MDHLTFMDDEALNLWLLWGQSEEDRAGIAEFFAEERTAAAGEAKARAISETGTVADRPALLEETFRRAA